MTLILQLSKHSMLISIFSKILLSTSACLPLACWYLWGSNIVRLSYFSLGYLLFYDAPSHTSINNDTYAALHTSSDRVQSSIRIPTSVYVYFRVDFVTPNNIIIFVRPVPAIHLSQWNLNGSHTPKVSKRHCFLPGRFI